MADTTQVRRLGKGNGTPRKIVGEVKLSHRVFYKDGRSHYFRNYIARLEDESNKDIVERLAEFYKDVIEYNHHAFTHIKAVKLISVGGERFDRMVP